MEEIENALLRFEAAYGLEPTGILMHQYTYELIRMLLPGHEGRPTHYRGIRIYRSPDIEPNDVKLVL